MSLLKDIRSLAEGAWYVSPQCVEDAILTAIKLVLERKPSDEMQAVAENAIQLTLLKNMLGTSEPSDAFVEFYRAMNAQLLKDLGI
jgi:hypothetical protein